MNTGYYGNFKTNRVTHKIKIRAFLVASSTVILFSPRGNLKQEKKGLFTLKTEGCVFEFKSGISLTFKCSEKSLLIITTTKVMKETRMKGFLSALPSIQLKTSK